MWILERRLLCAAIGCQIHVTTSPGIFNCSNSENQTIAETTIQDKQEEEESPEASEHDHKKHGKTTTSANREDDEIYEASERDKERKEHHDHLGAASLMEELLLNSRISKNLLQQIKGDIETAAILTEEIKSLRNDNIFLKKENDQLRQQLKNLMEKNVLVQHTEPQDLQRLKELEKVPEVAGVQKRQKIWAHLSGLNELVCKVSLTCNVFLKHGSELRLIPRDRVGVVDVSF